MRCDLVLRIEPLVADHDPVTDRPSTIDIGDRDMLEVIECLGEAGCFLLEQCHCALLLVDGFRPQGARGISEGVKGTPAGGGEDKERSGIGAALTPKSRALRGKRPST
jgi:hypothetical protein